MQAQSDVSFSLTFYWKALVSCWWTVFSEPHTRFICTIHTTCQQIRAHTGHKQFYWNVWSHHRARIRRTVANQYMGIKNSLCEWNGRTNEHEIVSKNKQKCWPSLLTASFLYTRWELSLYWNILLLASFSTNNGAFSISVL